MRHAAEIGAASPLATGPMETRVQGHRLVCAGDAYGRFALRIEDRASRAWIARSRFVDRDLLHRLCPSGSGSLQLLHSLDSNGQPTIDVSMARHRCGAPGRTGDGSGSSEERQILIVGGLPRSTALRALVVAEIEDALRRGGMRVRTAAPFSRNAVAGEERAMEAHRHLALIAIACPGLVRVSGETK